MSSTLLVDSSVWIDHYRGRLDPAKLRVLTHAMQDHQAVLAPMVWLELVVGFRGPVEKTHLENIRAAVRWIELPDDIWTEAARNAGKLHAEGIVLRMPDLLVITLADVMDFKLLHCNKDFDRPLKLKQFARLRVEL
jgi:predicted nucleic acid-binding protein